ncbi:MAG: DUF2837 family protein [Candidatus Eremiobacteraeota bacterium]|nr:DUF2837 family protein [Candidatus Eremiobacteraeota bacterium]
MDFSLLADPSLVFISLIAGVVALATSLNIAARPAAVKTAKVMLAFTMANFFFMLTRFANLFYAPLMAKFVDTAASTGNTGLLAGQLRWVILGSALGGLASWICLNTFIEIYRRGIICIEHRQSLARALLRLAHPRAWKVLLGAVRKPSNLGVKLFKLEGIPVGFLLANVFATAVWTVGVMAALLVSAELPGMEQTAVLLSGLVNAFAAIAFSVWVDPKAAVITDQAIRGERPQKHVDITAVHLSMGNFLGGLLGLMMLNPAASLIRVAAKSLGEQGETMNNNLWIIVLFNLAFAFLASTTYASRISAVRTARAATAVAVYNFFFLIARLGQQVFAPMIGAISDHVTANPNLGLPDLAVSLRFVLLGASLGALLSWLFMPTLVEVYDRAIRKTDELGSIHAVLVSLLNPLRWAAVIRCFRFPSTFGIGAADLKRIPKTFILANVFVIGIHTVGVVASVYAGAAIPDLERTASLLSSVVNGFATIALGLIVDPTAAVITQETLDDKRPVKDVYTMGLLLIGSMFLGTLMSQALLEPARWVIETGAQILAQVL